MEISAACPGFQRKDELNTEPVAVQDFSAWWACCRDGDSGYITAYQGENKTL